MFQRLAHGWVTQMDVLLSDISRVPETVDIVIPFLVWESERLGIILVRSLCLFVAYFKNPDGKQLCVGYSDFEGELEDNEERLNAIRKVLDSKCNSMIWLPNLEFDIWQVLELCKTADRAFREVAEKNP
jgi:hypothetical protein